MSKAEEFIKKQSHIIKNPTSVWISSYNARRAVEIAREEIYKWLEKNAHKYATIGIYTDAMILDLKQVIKDNNKEN